MSSRKKVTRRIESICYDNLETILRQVTRIIEAHPELSYKDFVVDTYYEYSDEARPCIEYQTDETDLEMKKRLEREELIRRSNEKRDRLAYEQLKKRFE